MQVQSCCFAATKNLLLFAVFVAVAVAVVVKLRLVVILGWVVQSWVKITQR